MPTQNQNQTQNNNLHQQNSKQTQQPRAQDGQFIKQAPRNEQNSPRDMTDAQTNATDQSRGRDSHPRDKH